MGTITQCFVPFVHADWFLFHARANFILAEHLLHGQVIEHPTSPSEHDEEHNN
jgi:hypothetical protein